ncbi:folate-binding protein [Qipengyuania aquimaris]|uniref:CAF17-like 4Fe-4S cluster assembly/insertion protein YgfZ n=1 Tax=Qipengyuania aquimaris TaxID=255984 RepID=UPI001C94D221|nr:folate-binding protein [Qipengyuania aquimaris]MBY6128228.1 folate-binding protein [Qipengyuania aquimaris]
MTATRLMNRAVIRLSPQEDGDNVIDFLQGLLTNDLKQPLPVYAALLTPQGKTMFDMFVWPSGDGGVLLDCEAEGAADLAKRLSLYRLRRKIDIAIEDSVAVHWERHAGDGGAPDPRLTALGQRWLAPVSDNDKAADDAYLAHRLAMGVPEGRAEMGDILWLETNAVELHGVAFDKGCYIGQENTARMNWRSKVNRRLVVVPLDQSDEKRRKAAYEDLGLAVDHLRVSDIDASAAPDWMKPGLSPSE